jgi:hypothetical protein
VLQRKFPQNAHVLGESDAPVQHSVDDFVQDVIRFERPWDKLDSKSLHTTERHEIAFNISVLGDDQIGCWPESAERHLVVTISDEHDVIAAMALGEGVRCEQETAAARSDDLLSMKRVIAEQAFVVRALDDEDARRTSKPVKSEVDVREQRLCRLICGHDLLKFGRVKGTLQVLAAANERRGMGSENNAQIANRTHTRKIIDERILPHDV